MEIETYELTIDDVLALHRSWITDVFLIERKSEVEIVELLYNRQLVVSVAQIHQCLLEWNLIRHPRSATNSVVYEDWDLSSAYSPTASTSYNNTSSQLIASPNNVELYIRRPLPPLPSSISSGIPPSTKKTKYPKGKHFDKQRLQLTSSVGYEHMKQEIDPASNATDYFENYVLDRDERPAMGSDYIPRSMCSRQNEVKNSKDRSYSRARKSNRDRNSDKFAKK